MKTLKRHNVFLISMDCGLSPVCKWHTLTYYSYILKTNETQDILCSYHVIIQTHDNSFWSLCTKKQKHLSLCLWKLLLYATPSPPPMTLQQQAELKPVMVAMETVQSANSVSLSGMHGVHAERARFPRLQNNKQPSIQIHKSCMRHLQSKTAQRCFITALSQRETSFWNSSWIWGAWGLNDQILFSHEIQGLWSMAVILEDLQGSGETYPPYIMLWTFHIGHSEIF